jgi:hypothetical protein
VWRKHAGFAVKLASMNSASEPMAKAALFEVAQT